MAAAAKVLSNASQVCARTESVRAWICSKSALKLKIVPKVSSARGELLGLGPPHVPN